MFANITQSPTLVRVVPFGVFVLFTVLQDHFGVTGRFWLYFGKSVLGAALLLAWWKHIPELKWKFTWEALLFGVGVFVMWVGLDEALVRLGLAGSYPKMKVASAPWNPIAVFGEGTVLAWFFIVARIAGASIVVPMIEEIFYRSFVYRYLASKDFLSVPLNRYLPLPFFGTAVLFGLAHREWLAGILCAFAYQGLVLWRGRLGDAITAHGLTNFLLGLYVVWKGAWEFW